MSNLPINSKVRRLTDAEKRQFEVDGYVKSLPVFATAAVPTLQAKFRELADLLPDEVDINRIYAHFTKDCEMLVTLKRRAGASAPLASLAWARGPAVAGLRISP